MRPAFRHRIEQIRRGWWVVFLVTAIAVLAAALPSLTAHPTYVGKSVLVMSSEERLPEQDTNMVIGFSTLFNDPATIERLRAQKNIPEDVWFETQPVAASPILNIEATADDPVVAQDAAASMAEAFRDEINSAARKAIDDAIADRERQFSELLERLPDAAADSVIYVEDSFQQYINKLRFDSTNQLQDLQPRAGVTESAPSVMRGLVMGAAGGLLLGILIALGMAALSSRIRNSAELMEKTGIEPLVEVPPGRSVRKSNLREDRIRTLGNIVSSHDSPKPLVIALTDSRGARGARVVAEALSKVLAQQEYRTVLVYADNNTSRSAEDAAFNDVLRDSDLVHQMLEGGEVESLKILPWCGFFASRYSRVTRERIVAVLDELRARADIIVVAAPSIAESTDAQLLCAAADLTILVADTRSSRAGDVTAAVEALGTARAAVLGVVLLRGTQGQLVGQTTSTSTGRHSLRPGETADQGSPETLTRSRRR